MHAGEKLGWRLERSMDLLTQLRDRLTGDQRKMLNAIWGYYRENGHWITRKRLHHLFRDRLQVNEVQAPLEGLGGCVVYEARDDQKECYALTFLGILMTDQGPELEELCVRYLDHVRKLYDQDPDVEVVNGKQIQTDLGISPEQSKLLGALISFGGLFAAWAGQDSPSGAPVSRRMSTACFTIPTFTGMFEHGRYRDMSKRYPSKRTD
jgi:hypothetical protein